MDSSNDYNNTFHIFIMSGGDTKIIRVSKMNNLVVFGCSHTTGMGINYEDSNNHTGEINKNAWPHVLGKLINLNVINNGIEGSGCKETSYNVLNYDFHKNDVVVVLWPNIIRNCIIKKNSVIRLKPWETPYGNNLHADYWFKYFQSDSDDIFSNFMYITATEKILENKVSSITHSFHDKNLLKIFDDTDDFLKIFETKKVLKSFYRKPFYSTYKKYGKGKDGIHLNEKAHKMFANDLYNHIKN